MLIQKADISNIEIIKEIVNNTILEIYPKYYPTGAVDFFVQHHNLDNIKSDIEAGCVYIECDNLNHVVGTVTIKENEICRLFVLPVHQGKGYGRKLLDFAEGIIKRYSRQIILDASLPAKRIYLKRGYKEIEYHVIETENGDYLCHDVMQKEVC